MIFCKKVMEIKSQAGVLHFTRWCVIGFPLLNMYWYLDKISKSDEDEPHDHPWNYIGIILKGRYVERIGDNVYRRRPFNIVFKKATTCHKIIHLVSKEVYTMIFTFGKKRVWGYQTKNGWVDSETYRILKKEGKL